MRPSALAATTLLLMPALIACTSEAVKQGAYEALYQKQCMDRAGTPYCDPAHSSYEQYKKDRDELLIPER
jgi:hypothetical protein